MNKDLVIKMSKKVPELFEDPIPEDTEQLGHIVAENTGLKIGHNETMVFAVIHPNQMDNIELGDYVRVPYYQPNESHNKQSIEHQLLASVSSISHNTILDDRQYTGSETYGVEQYQHIARLDPLSLISVSDSEDKLYESEFVSKPPTPTVRIDKVNDKEFLRSGLEIPDTGIYVGDMAVNGNRVPSVDNPLEYYLFNPNETDYADPSGEPSIFRHVLVSGSTGTGKTHTSKNILRQFSKCKEYDIDVPPNDKDSGSISSRTRKLNITIIDPEDEYTEMGEDPIPENMDRAKELAEKREGLEYGAVGQNTNFQIFAPVTANNNPQDLNIGNSDVVNFSIPFSIVKDHRQLLMPDDPEGPTKQIINKSIQKFFYSSSAPDEKTYKNFNTWFSSQYMPTLKENDVYNDNSIYAAKRRMTDRKVYDSVFDHSSNEFTSKDMIRDIFSQNQVSVITTGHLRGRVQNLIVQSMASYIVENKISSDADSPLIKGTPLVLALDEAHEYVSYPETSREKIIVDKFRRAARRGRKDKFGLYFITQNPADIDGEVRNQINTKIYMQLDQRVVNDPDVYVPKKYSGSIPQFNKGQMVVKQPDIRPVEIVGLDTCLTRHSK